MIDLVLTLKIVLWALYTIWQAVLKGLVILRQKAYFGPDYDDVDDHHSDDGHWSTSDDYNGGTIV